MASRFWVGGAGTWDNSDTTHWSATTGGAGGQSVPASGDTVTFDGSSGGGTVTVAATINGTNTVTSITAGAFTGTLAFNTNNPNINAATMSISGAGTRTINMGSGTFTLTTSWDATTTTGLTFSGASCTIVIADSGGQSAQSFNTGGLTYGTLQITARTASATLNVSNNSPTFATVSIAGPCRVNLPSMTITNAIAWAGTSSGLIVLSAITAGSSTITLSAAGGTIQWASISAMTFATNSVAATNSYSNGSTSNVTISNPSSGGGARVIGG